jgi:outer membrane receptor for ferrienterochelin and colicin
MDVLEKSPGIQVDKDGNISLKGKQGVMVMLDGRPTYLSGTELANLLRGMESSQIEQIEIMTNPPAKYDAAGNSGVINIKTKKNKLKGFNGNATATIAQGKYSKNE